MSEKILVTGASGFIGTRLVRRLNARGDQVVAVDILPPRETLPGVQYVTHDVRTPLPADLATGCSVIFNLAAVHRTPGHPENEYFETNIAGALNVTAAAEAAGVETIVFTSSISVYGPSEALMDEASPPQPVSSYGKSKLLAEQIHKRWQAGAPDRRLVVVRPAVVFGPGERGNYTSLANALRGGYFLYPGRTTTVKSGGYVDELLATFDFALGQQAPQILYNFAYPDLNSTADIVAAFNAVTGRRSDPPTVPIWPMLVAAFGFEVLARLGLTTPIHRERIWKLVRSTKIRPGWLLGNGYAFGTDLKGALTLWRDETGGRFD